MIVENRLRKWRDHSSVRGVQIEMTRGGEWKIQIFEFKTDKPRKELRTHRMDLWAGIDEVLDMWDRFFPETVICECCGQEVRQS